jgi:2-dehydro-3-deoxygalactonokinase
MNTALIGVDWGTSNLRAWAFDGQGRVLAEASNDAGVSTVASGQFAGVLRALVGEWSDGTTPIILGGMVGSRQGWREAPYLPCPAQLSNLADQALRLEAGIGPGWIVPGLSCEASDGILDVMRGEEVQLAGANVADGTVLLPGTHSKWVRMSAGAACSVRTVMTGELFALLTRHSLLGRLMAPGGDDPDAFDLGVDRSLASPAISASLFSVRTEGLFQRIAPSSLSDYLSGLLIGAEVAAMTGDAREQVTIVATGKLASRYARALQRAGAPHPLIVPGDEASSLGLLRIARLILEKEPA